MMVTFEKKTTVEIPKMQRSLRRGAGNSEMRFARLNLFLDGTEYSTNSAAFLHVLCVSGI